MDKTNKQQEWRQLIGRTHTARMARGTMQFSKDSGLDVEMASDLLKDIDDDVREVVDQLLREGRY